MLKRILDAARCEVLCRKGAGRVGSIVLGSAILTFGIHNIHQVVGITEGGMIGAMLLINHWFGVPASVLSPILDVLCYALGFCILGAAFLGWSAISSIVLAAFYALWEHLPHLLPDLSAHPLLAAVLGGVFVGVGAGIVVRAGASAGGDDALALSISKLTGFRLARCYLFTDLSVLALSLSYIPVAAIVYSLITVTVSSLLIDRIVGWRSESQCGYNDSATAVADDANCNLEGALGSGSCHSVHPGALERRVEGDELS